MISLHCGHELSYVPRFAALWRPVVHIRTVHSISCMQGLRKCTVLTAASSWLSIPTASVKQGKPKESERDTQQLQQRHGNKQPGSKGVWRLLGNRSPGPGQEDEEEELCVETGYPSNSKTSRSFTSGSSPLGGKPPLVPSSLRTASVTAMPGYSLGPNGWQPHVGGQLIDSRHGSTGSTSPAPQSFFKDDMQRRGKGSSLAMSVAGKPRPASVLGISAGSHNSQEHQPNNGVYQIGQIGGDVITTEGGLPHRAHMVPHPLAPVSSPTASSAAGATGGLTSPHLTSSLGSLPGTPSGTAGGEGNTRAGGAIAAGVDPLMVNPTRGPPASYDPQQTGGQTLLPPPPPSSSLGMRSSVGTPTLPAPPSSASHKLRRNSVPAELLASFQASMVPAGHVTPTGVRSTLGSSHGSGSPLPPNSPSHSSFMLPTRGSGMASPHPQSPAANQMHPRRGGGSSMLTPLAARSHSTNWDELGTSGSAPLPSSPSAHTASAGGASSHLSGRTSALLPPTPPGGKPKPVHDSLNNSPSTGGVQGPGITGVQGPGTEHTHTARGATPTVGGAPQSPQQHQHHKRASPQGSLRGGSQEGGAGKGGGGGAIPDPLAPYAATGQGPGRPGEARRRSHDKVSFNEQHPHPQGHPQGGQPSVSFSAPSRGGSNEEDQGGSAVRVASSLELLHGLQVISSDDPSLYANPLTSAHAPRVTRARKMSQLQQQPGTAAPSPQGGTSRAITPAGGGPEGGSSRGHFAAHLRASFMNSGKLDAAILGDHWLTPHNGPSSNSSNTPQPQPQPQLHLAAGCDSKGHWREAKEAVAAGPGSSSTSTPQQQQPTVSLAAVEAAGASTGSNSSRSGAAGLFAGLKDDPLTKLFYVPETRPQGSTAFDGYVHKVQPGGVSLRYLFKLDDALSPATKGAITVRELVENLVVPRTQAANCRFLEFVPPVYRSQAKAFLCYAWDGDFHAMVAQLRRYTWEQGIDPATHHVWVDFLCSNLHPVNLSPKDLGTLKEIIRSCKQVIVVLDALATPLMRTWCWYEIWAALVLDPKSKYVSTPDRLHLVAYDVDWSHISGSMYEPRVEMTSTAVPGDRQRLLADIQGDEELATSSLSQLGPAMLEGLIRAARMEISVAEKTRTANPRKYASAACKHALLLCAAGRYWEAEKATRAVLLDHFEHTNLKQSDVAHVTAGLAVLAGEQGFWEESHRLLQEALRVYDILREQGKCEDEVMTKGQQARHIAVRATLAHVLFMQQRWPECDRMCREVMVAHQQQKSEAGAGKPTLVCDRSYITVLRQMALLRARAGQLDRSLRYSQEAVALSEKHLHPEHMDTLEARVQLARLLQCANKHDQALEVFDKALAGEQAVHGQYGGNTIVIQAMRVLCLLWGGRLEAATELAQSLPALVDAGNHTVESKAAGLAGRYVPCHDSQGPALRLGSSPFKAVMEVLEYVRDSWLERAREAQGVKANERAVEVALKATLALQYTIRARIDSDESKDLARNLQRELGDVMRKQGKVLDTKQWPA